MPLAPCVSVRAGDILLFSGNWVDLVDAVVALVLQLSVLVCVIIPGVFLVVLVVLALKRVAQRVQTAITALAVFENAILRVMPRAAHTEGAVHGVCTQVDKSSSSVIVHLGARHEHVVRVLVVLLLFIRFVFPFTSQINHFLSPRIF